MMEECRNKRVLFVTTKNLDYLRNTQEIDLLKEQSDQVYVIGSNKKSYPARLLSVYMRLLFLSMKKFDVVFVGFAPQLIMPLFHFKMKKKYVIIDFFISVYDTLVFDRKKFKPKSVAAKLVKRLDTKTIQKADKVISDTKAHGEYFTKEFGLEPQKLEVLYLKADTRIYYPRENEKPERMQNRFTVLYFGSVLPLQGLDIILEAVELLKDAPQFHFIIVGPIQDKYIRPKSSNIEYHVWLSQEELAEYISYSDLCLAGHFNKTIQKAKRTIPGKAYIYRAMDKPMILGENAANHELYSEQMQGIYFVEMGNPNALADKIRTIAGNE